MSWQPSRDFVGYANTPPDPKWPNGARLALNFVMNYEEGSEPSIQDGESYTESGLTEAHGMNHGVQGRDLAAEGMFEYGSRVGFWRLVRLFEERGLPLTIFGCALALERNPLAAAKIREAAMGADEGVLRDLLGILLVAQELVHHSVDAVPITTDHFVKGSFVAAFEAVDQEAIQGYFLSFRGHTFRGSVMRVFLDCSQIYP